MGVQIQKPDVIVEQVFEEEAVALTIPGLPACLVGINNQLEYQKEAGSYDGTATSYSYPLLTAGAEVDVASVRAFLKTLYGIFEIDSGDFTADADSVDVEANVFVEREVNEVSDTGISSAAVTTPANNTGADTTAGTRTFDDGGATFVTNGLIAGGQLFILDGNDAGNYIIESVDSETQLTVKATPWTGFTAFAGDTGKDYRVLEDNSTFADNDGDFLDDGVTAGMYVRILSGADAGDYYIEEVLSDKQLRIGLGLITTQANGQTNAASDVFTDATISFDDVSVGDIIVIEAGADAGTYGITEVIDSNNIRLDANMTATASSIQYRVSRKLAASTSQSYVIVNKSNEDTGDVLVSYEALRTDNIGILVTIDNGNDIEAKLGAIHPDNPLAYGAFVASQITDAPFYVTAVRDDTSEAHLVAAEFLESQEVYALGILSQDIEVNQLWAAHVTAQSDMWSKHERICFINRELFIQSEITTGTAGATDVTGQVFTDGGATFITDGVVAGNVIEVGSEEGRILRVDSETQITFVAPGITGSQTGLTYSVLTRALDKQEQADFIAAYSGAFANRRVCSIWPSNYKSDYTDVDGTVIENATLPGYFFCAQAAAQVQEFFPQTPHTNQPMVDTRDLLYSNRYFTPTQLNIIAGGGTYIVVQDEPEAAPYSRHQLTTDVSTIERRELSITKVVDHVAKLARNTLRQLIGRNVITPHLLDLISATADSVIALEVENGVLIAGTVDKVEQDEDQPDTVLVDMSVDVPYPVNYIHVRIIV